MLRRSLALGAVVSLFLGVGAAQASGWGRYYIGLNAGTGSSETDTTRKVSGAGYFNLATSVPAIEAASAMSLEEETFAGGAQIGVNWPIAEHFLLGFELDATG